MERVITLRYLNFMGEIKNVYVETEVELLKAVSSMIWSRPDVAHFISAGEIFRDERGKISKGEWIRDGEA